MKCPSCQDSHAYVGIHEVECLNSECPHFSEAYLEKQLAEAEADFDALIENLGFGDEFHAILLQMW